MSLWELFVIAVGLSMDAFAVAICKGLSVGRVRGSHAVTEGIYFGGFQMLMPLLGYLLGVRFQEIIAGVDHWIAFLLLGLIGANMIRESRGGEEHVDSSFRPRSMLPLAVATSIDALAVGISFAFTGYNNLVSLTEPLLAIGFASFAISLTGSLIGIFFGKRFNFRMEFFGGLVLIGIGTKILIEHLFLNQ